MIRLIRPPAGAILPLALAFAIAACASSGCAWMYSAPTPVATKFYPASPNAQASTLLVLLPGRGDEMTSWAEHGFMDDLRVAGLSIDVIAVDASIGYYMKETIVERVRTDVLEPAHQKGYRHVWIGGASMGGLGALIMASRVPGTFDRVILLSPYLGPSSLIDQIAAAGGPARWTPTDLKDPYQRIWRWLQQYREPGAPMPVMTLGFANQESLATANRLLGQLLPADRVFSMDGKHGWAWWRPLWQREFAAFARGL